MKKKSIITWILEFAKIKRRYFRGSIVLAVFGVAASFIPYIVIADVVSQLLVGNREWNYYFRQVILMGVAWIVRYILHSLSTSLSHYGTFTVLGEIRKQLCEKLSKIPLGIVLDDHSGSYKNIIVERVDSMETTLAHIIPEFTANLLLPVIMFIYIMFIDWRLGLANLIGALIGVFCATVMMFKSRGEFEKTVEKTKHLNDTAVEYINGIEVIKAFGKTGSSYEKFVVAAREGADCFINWMRKCIWWQAGTFSFMPATFLGVLPIGLILVKNGSLTPENFFTCIILSAGLITPLTVAFSYMDDILKVKTIFGEVTEILERKDMIRPDELSKEPNGSDIKLKDVHFTYKEKEVLHGIDMEIKQGEVNVAKRCGCHEFVMGLENGYETIVGGAGGHLSGGERQRICIARAMLKDSPIVILDEATANVDPENEKELTQAVENLTKEKTIIMIAHRLKTVRNADQIIVVDKGRIVQKGKHDELMKMDGIYRNFVQGRKQAVGWKLS
ncbi:MAG: ABC transporter ATP-binding protein [Lachnospiraceae bacterium]|nr:ABC transporter ATP-binding protein [Lachnospiraceae bacterium]